MPNRIYLLNLTQANIKNGSIYLSECMDVFPADTLGGANKLKQPRAQSKSSGIQRLCIPTSIGKNESSENERGCVSSSQ